MNQRPLVIYHGNCADGFSAAWCFWRKYGTGADYVAGAANPLHFYEFFAGGGMAVPVVSWLARHLIEPALAALCALERK